MIEEFAPAKVNLSLRILARRADRYHEIDSIVAFADVGDRLRFAPADRWTLKLAGPFADAVPGGEDNLVLKAARALAGALPNELPPAAIELEKHLPPASGLGGGSADAAAVLRGLARLWRQDVPKAEMLAIAATIGADVPMCLLGAAARVTGIGEIVCPLKDFAPVHAVLMNPGTPLATAAVFAEFGLPRGTEGRVAPADPLDQELWTNDLTAAACRLVPDVAVVIQRLQADPDVSAARMSGSGATCFGLTASAQAARLAADRIRAEHAGWWCQAVRLA